MAIERGQGRTSVGQEGAHSVSNVYCLSRISIFDCTVPILGTAGHTQFSKVVTAGIVPEDR